MSSDKRSPAAHRSYDRWEARFVSCAVDLLAGRPLEAASQAFFDRICAAAELIPGELENALLEFALTSDDAEAEERLAAASVDAETLYDAVQQAVDEGKDRLSIVMGGADVMILKINPTERIVEPCYSDRFTFLVEQEGGATETVQRYGGIFLSFEQLRRLKVVYGDDGKTLRLARP